MFKKKSEIVMEYKHNKFLDDLLSFQQDGDLSISGPVSWDKKNLFEIETKLTIKALEIAERIKNTDEPIWYFLIGSPGNGKSHLVGKFFNYLNADDWEVKNKKFEGDPNEYVVKIGLKEEKHSRVWLLQDASSVKSTFDKQADEGSDLADFLQEAYEKKVSIVVCANRGIIEKINEVFSPKCSDEKWFKVIRFLIKNNPIRPKELDFKDQTKFEIKKDELDISSLFDDEVDSKTVALQILEKATEHSSWEVCELCKAQKTCPFKANKDSLTQNSEGGFLLELMRNAELYSGQVIVFREFLALVSLILAGNKIDYHTSPCSWVHEMNEEENYFAFLLKRYYMVLFSFNDSLGLGTDYGSVEKDLETLRLLIEDLERKGGYPNGNILKSFVKEENFPAKNVGVDRLLGARGSLRIQDPFFTGLESGFLTQWSLEYVHNELDSDGENTMTLERQVFKEMNALLDWVDNNIQDERVRYSSLIQRWTSSFTTRLGAVKTKNTHFVEELSEFNKVICAAKRQINSKNQNDHYLIRDTEKDLNEVLNGFSRASQNDAANTYQVSENLLITGDRVSMYGQLHIHNSISPPYLSLPCFFGKRAEVAQVHLGGLLFCWLLLVKEKGLIPMSIEPKVLEAILQAQAKEVARSDYSRAGDGIAFKLFDPIGLDKATLVPSNQYITIKE